MNVITFDKNIIEAGNIVITTPFSVLKAWLVESASIVIVLMNPNDNMSVSRFNNLIAYDINRPFDVLWQAELPTSSGPDCYTETTINDNIISAFSFSCHRCKIDIKNGSIMSKTFTK